LQDPQNKSQTAPHLPLAGAGLARLACNSEIGKAPMSTATQAAEATPERIDLYRVRDEYAQAYAPADALERMLVSQLAQSWIRLQRAQEAEEKYFRTRDVLDAITNDYDRYKAITRYVSDCERAWRHVMLHLEKVQRRRQRNNLASPLARRRPAESGAGSQPTRAGLRLTSAEPADTLGSPCSDSADPCACSPSSGSPPPKIR
jgi:hypothetical protein